MARSRTKHVVCVEDEGYAASIERRKIYTAIADQGAERLGLVRVVDESGEDYLYPVGFFADIKVTPKLGKALSSAG